jgi:hypothetical protein
MYQPDLLSARVMALEDVEVYVEDLAFLRALCAETLAVKRETPMQARPGLPKSRLCVAYTLHHWIGGQTHAAGRACKCMQA